MAFLITSAYLSSSNLTLPKSSSSDCQKSLSYLSSSSGLQIMCISLLAVRRRVLILTPQFTNCTSSRKVSSGISQSNTSVLQNLSSSEWEEGPTSKDQFFCFTKELPWEQGFYFLSIFSSLMLYPIKCFSSVGSLFSSEFSPSTLDSLENLLENIFCTTTLYLSLTPLSSQSIIFCWGYPFNSAYIPGKTSLSGNLCLRISSLLLLMKEQMDVVVSLMIPFVSTSMYPKLLFCKCYTWKRVKNTSYRGSKAIQYVTGMMQPAFRLMKPWQLCSLFDISSQRLADSFINCVYPSMYIQGMIFQRRQSVISSLKQPKTSVNMRLHRRILPRLSSFADMTKRATSFFSKLFRQSSALVLLARSKCFWSEPFLASSRIFSPAQVSCNTEIRYTAQLCRTYGMALQILISSAKLLFAVWTVWVILEPIWLSLIKSGVSSISSVQNSLCSLTEKVIASSHRETWLSKRISSMRSELFSSSSSLSRFSLMIFLKRQMMNCWEKLGFVFSALTNYSQALFLFLVLSRWKSAYDSLSLVELGNFFKPSVYVLSMCFNSCLQFSSISPSSSSFFFLVAFRGQSSSMHASLCFQMYPMSSMQEFLSFSLVWISIRMHLRCSSSCSPDLNFRFEEEIDSVVFLLPKKMMIAMNGSPPIHATSPPVKLNISRNWLRISMKLVQKQQLEQILKNLETLLLQYGSLAEYSQNIQDESTKRMMAQVQDPSKGTKLKMHWHTILLMMKAISALEFCLAWTLLEDIRGSNIARVTMVEMKMKMPQKVKVTTEWKRCHPSQHTTSGQLLIVVTKGLYSLGMHWATDSRISVMGMKKTVTNKGTTCPRITRGHVNLNFFLLKLQLTYTMSTMMMMITTIRMYSSVRKVPQPTPGRYDTKLKMFTKAVILLSVSPPFQAYCTASLNGNSNIWMKSAPASQQTSMVLSSSSSLLSRSTKRTLKMESLRAFQSSKMVFFFSKSSSVEAYSLIFIQIIENRRDVQISALFRRYKRQGSGQVTEYAQICWI